MVVDSSAWIEYLRDGDPPLADLVQSGIEHRAIVVTDPVVLELLAGARSDREERALVALLGSARYEPCVRGDYVEAARIHRACRAAGRAVRGMLDCVIAAVAIRLDLPLVATDRDFGAIASVSPLVLATRER